VKKIVKNLLWRLGFELKYYARPIYVDDRDIEHAKSIIDGYTMLSHACLTSLADQVGYCNSRKIPGAFVECGVWKGGAVALMAHISKIAGRDDRVLHLLDAFSDICAPDPKVDGNKALTETEKFGKYREGVPQSLDGIYASKGGHGTIQDCKNVILHKVGYPEANVNFHKGWFQDTAVEASKVIGPIALLRLDGDWYESTKICLEAFYDNVVAGGIIIIDDYLAYEGCRKAVDEFILSRNISVFLGRVDTVCYFFVKPYP
jgi:O-methyltransferase